MGDFSALAIRIKELRSSMKKTQREFAKYVGCTAATLSAYENGSKSPSLEIIKNIAEKCDVSLDWICGLTENKRETLELSNYGDAALLILKLIETDIMTLYEKPASLFPTPLISTSKILCCELKADIKELNDFFQTYMDLFSLKCEGRIKQNVIDGWLPTALEELKAIPIELSTEEFDEMNLNIFNEPSQEPHPTDPSDDPEE